METQVTWSQICFPIGQILITQWHSRKKSIENWNCGVCDISLNEMLKNIKNKILLRRLPFFKDSTCFLYCILCNICGFLKDMYYSWHLLTNGRIRVLLSVPNKLLILARYGSLVAVGACFCKPKAHRPITSSVRHWNKL